MLLLTTKPAILMATLGIAMFSGSLLNTTAQNATTQPADAPTAPAADQPQGECDMGPDMMKKMMGKMNGGQGMTGMCPMCEGMMGQKGGDGDMMAQCQGMMEKMGMPEDMVNRWQTMMRTPIFMDSPCAIYGQSARLDLTDEQKQQLIDIENEARAKSMAVLTDEQRDTLGDLPDKPMPMMKMCNDMQSRMKPMMKDMMGGMGNTDGDKGSGGCCSGSDS